MPEIPVRDVLHFEPPTGAEGVQDLANERRRILEAGEESAAVMRSKWRGMAHLSWKFSMTKVQFWAALVALTVDMSIPKTYEERYTFAV